MAEPAHRTSPRVLVVGLGIVSSIGSGRAAFTRGLREGACGIGPVTLFDVADQKTGIAAEVPGFAAADVLPAERRVVWSRSDALAIAAADQAARDAHLPGTALRRAGLFVGTTTAGMLENEAHLADLVIDAAATQPLTTLLSHPLCAPAERVAEALGIGGPRRTVCSACSSGAHAIAMAADAIRRGDCDVALAGGTDALCRLTYSGFNALGALDGAPCRPFDAARRGLNLGEAAAFLVLAREDRVPAGAVVVGELAGVGSLSEAHHITNPLATGAGARRAMLLALADAGLPPEAIGYVSAHGTGTPLNDPMECRAIASVFGEQQGEGAAEVWVSSTKSQLGHTLGAAGAVEAVAALLAMDGGFVPPTLRLSDVDPACTGVRHVGPQARDAAFEAFLSNSFGFGGADVSLCFARPGFAPPRRAVATRRLVVTGTGARLPAGGGEALAALEHDPWPPPGATASADTLDPARARRLDRFARLATDAAAQALSEAGLLTGVPPEDEVTRGRIGAALGTMWGSLDASASFMRRVIEQGARRAMPADFPNLVLSSAAGHLSIFHGLRGPAWTVSAYDASALCAIVTGAEEILAGRADAMIAGGVETTNDVILRVLEIFRGPQLREQRSEGAAAVLVEAEDSVIARGGRPLARVALCAQRTWAPGDEAQRERVLGALLGELSGITTRPRVYVPQGAADVARRARETLGPERVIAVEPRAGAHEAGGAIATALAVRAVAAGAVESALVLHEIAAGCWALAITRF